MDSIGAGKIFIYQNNSKRTWIHLDSALTTQLLVILILNSIKYANEGTIILLTINDQENAISFVIEDEGESIPNESLPLIFDWGYRAPNIEAKKYPGAGIGLFLAKRISDALNTKIIVKQTGKKVFFSFELFQGLLT